MGGKVNIGSMEYFSGKRTTMDNFTYNSGEGRARGGKEWETKLFSHRFHFFNPSLLMLTVTHYKTKSSFTHVKDIFICQFQSQNLEI